MTTEQKLWFVGSQDQYNSEIKLIISIFAENILESGTISWDSFRMESLYIVVGIVGFAMLVYFIYRKSRLYKEIAIFNCILLYQVL